MDVVITEKIVTTLDNADALEYFLNNDLNSRYEYRGWEASRRPKVLETMADGGKFVVVVERYTTAYIEDRIESYFKASRIVSGHYNGRYDHEAREAERLRQAKEQWNSRSILERFRDFMLGRTFFFMPQRYRIPFNVDYHLRLMVQIRKDLLP
jgi:hypothetical protein